MVLVSSLYAEYHGYHSMSSISETFSWLRPDAARGFTIVMLDTYIVIVQVLVGVLCYQRFVKLGHLMGAYRSNPAHYLGALDSVKRLEEDFLPPPQSSDTDVNADHNASDALRAVPSAVQSDDGDTVWENFERENLQSQARRTSVERIEPYRFQKTLQHATRIPATEGDAESNDSASVDLCLDEIRKHYKPRPGGYVESLLKIASFEEASREHSSRPSSRSTATFMDVVETSDSALRHLSIAEQRQVAINEPYHPLTQRKRSSSQEASDREKRGSRLPEVPSKIALAPPSSKIAGSFMNDDANHRSRVFSKIDTLRQLSSSSYGAVTNELVNMQLPSTTSKSWRDSYDEIRNMTRGLTSPHDNVAFTKFIEEENHRIRFQSFEGPEHVRQERHFREALPTGEGNICILSPNSFRTSRCTSQGTLNTTDPSLSQPLTGNSAINTLISIIPSWCCRLLLSLIKAVNRQGHARDMMNHYIWSPSPRSPTTNSFGLFAHTRIESWYIEWMHDFNYKFYTFTFKETLSIFLLCVFSDLLVVVRMYSTLEDSVELEAFFSWVRIIIMMLRYIMYPLAHASPFALAISRHDIYRLRRQKEILEAMNFVLSRQDKLPIGRNLDPDIVEGMNVMEVSLNSDCSHARLKVCIAGDSFQQRQGFSWLAKNNKLLRYRLAQLLRHRKNVPTLAFESHNLVQQAEVLMKMNDILLNRKRRRQSEEEVQEGPAKLPDPPVGPVKGMYLI
ncbi:hypothetical protein BaOVIS_021150 [Babesia ovis]|uniref:Uncharacterized protein n=1 Tax=Babesia ovis TaxID=5869 RepID=A0A9W5TC94_BABOV|nr:hypothetical protein BaOVIS_021150 [Babesia ovis]